MADVAEVVFSSGTNGLPWNACVWDPRAGTTLMTYKTGTAAPHTMCLLGNDYLLSAEPGKPIIRAWALNNHEQTQLRMVCPGPVHSLACTADGLFIAAGVLETLYIWQTASGHLLAAIKAHYQPISCLGFTDDGSMLVSGSEDCQLLVWDIAQAIGKTSLGDSNVITEVSPKYSFNHHTLPILDLYVGLGGKKALLASVSMDQSCKIYSLASGNLLLNLVFSVGLTSVTMNAVNSQVFLGSADGRIFSYLLHNAPRTPDFHIPADYSSVFKSHDKAVVCLSVSIDCTLLLSGSLDEKIIIWDILSRQMLRTLPHRGAVTNAFFTVAPKHVFSKYLKPSIVLKSLLRHSGNEESRCVEVIVRGTKDRSQSELHRMQEMLDRGDVPSTSQSNVSHQSLEQIHKLKVANENLYKFAVEKLLTPQQDTMDDEPVVVKSTLVLPKVHSKKFNKKKKKQGSSQNGRYVRSPKTDSFVKKAQCLNI